MVPLARHADRMGTVDRNDIALGTLESSELAATCRSVDGHGPDRRGIWFVARGDAIGLPFGEVGHRWLRDNLGQVLGWGEFALLSSLSCDYLVHLGVDHASDSDKSTRSMIATGALVWMLEFCQRTDWGAGWPLRDRPIRNLEGILLLYGTELIWTITLIQVTALVISAVRQSSQVLAEMDREDQELDPLRSRSDFYHDFDGVTTDRDKGRNY